MAALLAAGGSCSYGLDGELATLRADIVATEQKIPPEAPLWIAEGPDRFEQFLEDGSPRVPEFLYLHLARRLHAMPGREPDGLVAGDWNRAGCEKMPGKFRGKFWRVGGLIAELHAEAIRDPKSPFEYVHAGDCFQVNIAQRLLAPIDCPPLTLYQRLRERNPAPFAGYFDLGEHVILSASPERFMSVRHGNVETRPIKGTRPRGRTPADDRRLADELRASVKDRAENVMIVDLLRNDLGRVCEYGSIHVESLCRLESYQYVHHLVSEVRGRLRAEHGPADLLRASFPGGSVTGAPKIRAMEIIAELEQTARGSYCGCLGYIGFDGGMDTNIAIRTLTVSHGTVRFWAGGGIVADSEVESEYQESFDKARALLRLLEQCSVAAQSRV